MELLLILPFLPIIFLFSINFSSSLLTILYQKIIYQNLYKPKYNSKYQPECAIIIPVKGIPRYLEKNLSSFLQQKYPKYSIYYVTESSSDPATAIIKKIIKNKSQAKLVISHPTRSCAQKNCNLLSAIKKISTAQIYVFADADIIVHQNWLSELMMPLSDPNIYGSTTYYWLNNKQQTIGGYLHQQMNIHIYTMFVFSNIILKKNFLWGGSMAIRRTDFEKLNIADFWSKSVVDDTSLSMILNQNHLRTVITPLCLNQAYDPQTTLSGSINWFQRQLMFQKIYHRRLWLFALGPIATSYIIILFGFIFFLPINTIDTFSYFYLLVFLYYILSETTTAISYLFLGKIDNPLLFITLSPYLRFLETHSYFKTFFKKTITWSQITYWINSDGQVYHIRK